MLTNTAPPQHCHTSGRREWQKKSNSTLPTEVPATTPKLPANPDSDVMLTVSFGESEGDSDYVELRKNLPTRSARTLELEVHIKYLQHMHEVSEVYLK